MERRRPTKRPSVKAARRAVPSKRPARPTSAERARRTEDIPIRSTSQRPSPGAQASATRSRRPKGAPSRPARPAARAPQRPTRPRTAAAERRSSRPRTAAGAPYRPAPSRRRPSLFRWFAIAAIAIIAVIGIVAFQAGARSEASAPETEPVPASEAQQTVEETEAPDPYGLREVEPDGPIVVGAGSKTASGDGRMSFCAVGDNLIGNTLLASADRAAGTTGDGAYDFHQLYDQVAPTLAANYDVSFINQETVMAGAEFGYSGYPVFNSPDTVSDALADGGWDVVVCNSNHSNDCGTDALTHEIELWERFPDILTVGMSTTPEQTQAIHVIERNGIRLAVLTYVYGLNGYSLDDEGVIVANSNGKRLEGEGSFFNLVTEDKLKRDIPRAREVADAVVVSIHSGAEYVHEPNDNQRRWAQLAADLGCDAVIGTHSHYIEPVEWLTGEDGNETLVAWSLGDFVSGSNLMDASVGGVLSFDFVRDGDAIRIENPVWTPTLEHRENGIVSVRFLKDYTAAEAARNTLYTGYSFVNPSAVRDIVGYARELTSDVIGDTVPIDM